MCEGRFLKERSRAKASTESPPRAEASTESPPVGLGFRVQDLPSLRVWVSGPVFRGPRPLVFPVQGSGFGGGRVRGSGGA